MVIFFSRIFENIIFCFVFAIFDLVQGMDAIFPPPLLGERGGLVVNTSDSGSRGRGFMPHSGQTVLCP